MNGWVLTVIIVVAVIALIVKRFLGEPLNARDLFAPPVILLAIGVYSLTKLDVVDARDVLWIVGGGIVGLGMGALRGSTTVLFPRNGVLYQRYTVWTVVVWVASLAVNFGIGWVALAAGMHPEARQMTLSIGISLFGEMIIVGWRALASGHPFAPEKSRGSVIDGLRRDDRRDDSAYDRRDHPRDDRREYRSTYERDDRRDHRGDYDRDDRRYDRDTPRRDESLLDQLGVQVRRYVQDRRR